MPIRKIAVLGAGNGGCAAAADLTLRGYEIRLCSRSQNTLQPLLDRGGIELVEDGKEKLARPALITCNVSAAIKGADLIVIAAPAVAHEYFAAALVADVHEEQTIFLNPGQTGGALHFAHFLRKSRPKLSARMCETVTLSHICRLKGAARVEVYRRTSLRCAAFPGKLTAEIVPLIREIFINVDAAANVIETGLSNINAIMHPAGMVANAGWIEQYSGEFLFYAEGITPAVARVIAKVDAERLQIVRKLGLPALSFVEIFYQAGLTTGAARASASVYEAIRDSAPNKTIKSPASLNHRYLNEDVAYGLVPMVELARLLGIQTPVMDSLIELSSAMNSVDYRKEGLTLEKMGLSKLKPEELERLVQEGFR
jgi:opine dehydrogenase